MMKKLTALLLVWALAVTTLAACAKPADETTSAAQESPTTEETTKAQEETTAEVVESATIHIGSLKGPTSMGLMSLMDKASKGEAQNEYEFTMVTAADEVTAALLKGDLDIATVPANLASVLFNKTEGKISVINVNTLGVLYIVSGDTGIQSFEDLKGKTIVLTGKGTTPDYVINYLLSVNGFASEDVTLEYKSEPTEVVSFLSENPDAVGLLPQPFVTVACSQNEALSIVLDLNEEWVKAEGENGSKQVTGVTVVRNEFLENNEAAVKVFLEEYKASAEFANTNVEGTAELIAAAGIVPKAPIAAKALPFCNITYIDGMDMKNALSGYLEVLFEQNPASVGGALPTDEFYYLGK